MTPAEHSHSKYCSRSRSRSALPQLEANPSWRGAKHGIRCPMKPLLTQNGDEVDVSQSQEPLRTSPLWPEDIKKKKIFFFPSSFSESPARRSTAVWHRYQPERADLSGWVTKTRFTCTELLLKPEARYPASTGNSGHEGEGEGVGWGGIGDKDGNSTYQETSREANKHKIVFFLLLFRFRTWQNATYVRALKFVRHNH